jgi:hypothetical protein
MKEVEKIQTVPQQTLNIPVVMPRFDIEREKFTLMLQ